MGDGSKRALITDALPYSLTPSQRRAVGEIVADLERAFGAATLSDDVTAFVELALARRWLELRE